MDVRGNQASGYAWQSSTGSGIYKRDVAGAQLSMKPMSRGTRVAVLHTRFATHGSITDNNNNHPVLSPDRSVALVHNGVIYNHKTVRGEIPHTLPEVDSSVIPALLQEFDRNTDSFDKLDGDASVAWLDDNDRLTLKVARISYSPLTIAMLADGSFVFASTEAMLLKALDNAKLDAIYLETISERTLLTIENGSLIDVATLPDMDPKYEQKVFGGYGGWRTMTSGGYATVPASMAGKNESLFLPNDYYAEEFDGYYGEDLDGYYFNESMPGDDDYDFGLQKPEFYGYPKVVDYVCNGYGEYFDAHRMFMGSIDDFVHMGYLTKKDLDDFSTSWAKLHLA
jgi:predicted glutamine amidotransferase